MLAEDFQRDYFPETSLVVSSGFSESVVSAPICALKTSCITVMGTTKDCIKKTVIDPDIVTVRDCIT